MKNLIINEQQYENLMGNISHKKMFFKYWDKFGGKVDDNFYKLFGFKNTKLDNINKSDVIRFLREWYGNDKAYDKLKTLIEKNPHVVNNCGGYNFKFATDIDEYNQEDGSAYLNIVVLLNNSYVDLSLMGGDVMDLKDAIKDDEIGWEIRNEVQDCVVDYLDEITNQTGIHLTISHLEHI